jgi:hypothetical protein
MRNAMDGDGGVSSRFFLPTTLPSTLQTTTESKFMMILSIVLPILFVLLVAVSTYLFYRYRNHYAKINHSSQEDNLNNNIIDQNLVNFYREIMEVPSDAVDNMNGHVHNSQDPLSYDSNQSMRHIESHDISNDESNNRYPRQNDLNFRRSDEYSENYYHSIRSYDEARRRIDGFDLNDSGTNEGIFYDEQRIQNNSRVRQRNEGTSRDRRRAHRRNGASNEGRHQRRDNGSQPLEPVVRGELVSTVAGAVATDNEILNLPTAAVANIDEEDVLYVDLFVDV